MSDGGSGSSNAGSSGAQGATGTATAQAEGSAQVGSQEAATDQAAAPAEESAQPAEKTPKPAEETKQPEEAPPEDKPKHRHHDRLTKAFPDRQFESPEDYDTALDEYMGNVEKENGELKTYRENGQKANQRLISLFEAEPEVGSIVRDMINGASFREALARHISPEDLAAVEGDPDYEGWNKNKIAREEAATKRRQYEQQFEENLKLSEQAIKEFGDENGMDQEAATTFLGKVDEMVAALMSGNITKDALTRMKRAFDYDNDVAAAKDTGEIAGRNQAIVAKKEKAPEGDGLPKISAAGETPEQKAPNYFENLANRIKSRQQF